MNSTDLTSTETSSQQIFLNSIFPGARVSLRCVAEAPELKEKLKKLELSAGGNGKRLDIIKLLASELPQEEQLRMAEVWNSKGYAIYYLPQEFLPGYDESYSSIVRFRAFVIDLDGAPLAPVQEFELAPSMIIESSPGKYQAIWKIDCGVRVGAKKGPDELTIDEYNELSSKLAAVFSADQNVARATQAFRMPGYLHCKKGVKNGFRVSIISQSSTNCIYSVDNIRAALRMHNKKSSVNGVSGNGSAVPLDPLILGVAENKVGLGSRHSTLLKVQTKLLHSGLAPDVVETKCMDIIKQSFENPQDFLPGGVRELEMKRSLQDAQGYVAVAKEEEDLAVRQVLDTPAEAVEETESTSESAQEGYNFGSRSLKKSRYTENAAMWRTLQKFGADLARVDSSINGGRCYCFNNTDKLWIPQTNAWYGEVRQRVEYCVSDMLNEDGFSVSLLDDKGKLSKVRLTNAISHFYSMHTLNNIARGILNNMAVNQYDYSDFDAHPALLYCSNGVVDLLTGEIRDARNEDRLLNRTSVSWCGSGEGSECPRWLAFLGQVFAENNDPADMIRFTQELFGYSLSGWINEEKLFCHQGDGANGKSKLLSALRLVAGNYATIVEPEELVVKRGGFGKAFERTGAKVEGKRCVIIDDFEVDSEWNEAFVKLLTGPSIRARGEYEKSRVAPNRAKFHIGLNKAPRPEAENLGILRRLCIIPYPRTFAVDPDKSREIDKMILGEAPGILRWAAEGLRRAKGGIAYPAETTAALEEYRVENFKLENVIVELFDFPSSDTEPNSVWSMTSDLLEDVNTALRDSLGIDMRVSPDMLGIALRRAGALREKRWNAEARNTRSHFLVRRKSTTSARVLGL